jgi:hypothetical protein
VRRWLLFSFGRIPILTSTRTRTRTPTSVSPTLHTKQTAPARTKKKVVDAGENAHVVSSCGVGYCFRLVAVCAVDADEGVFGSLSAFGDAVTGPDGKKDWSIFHTIAVGNELVNAKRACCVVVRRWLLFSFGRSLCRRCGRRSIRRFGLRTTTQHARFRRRLRPNQFPRKPQRLRRRSNRPGRVSSCGVGYCFRLVAVCAVDADEGVFGDSVYVLVQPKESPRSCNTHMPTPNRPFLIPILTSTRTRTRTPTSVSPTLFLDRTCAGPIPDPSVPGIDIGGCFDGGVRAGFCWVNEKGERISTETHYVQALTPALHENVSR